MGCRIEEHNQPDSWLSQTTSSTAFSLSKKAVFFLELINFC